MKEKKVLTLEEIATLTQSQLIGNASHQINNVAELDNATTHDASFLSNSRYKQALKTSQAGVVFIDSHTPIEENKNFLITQDPSRAFQQLVEIFHPPRKVPSGFKGIHPTAVIHESAHIGQHVTIGPYAVIDEHVVIDDHTFIGSGTYIGPYSKIGKNCLIHPRVTIREESVLHNEVIIQPGAIIGSCGFGYTTDQQGRHIKLNQVGNVVIEENVEIGANTTLDRARFKSTRIEKGSKIDNLVQIGHGAKIGAHNIIVAQAAIAGSTSTGKYVILAGQVAVAGHLHLADGVIVAGKSGVTKSLKKGKYNGIPAVPVEEYNRNSVYLRRINAYIEQIKVLEKRIQLLEEQILTKP